MNEILSPRQRVAMRKLFDNETAFLLYGGGAGGGKSVLGCMWLYISCIQYPGTRWFIGRDSLTDTRDSVLVTWSWMCSRFKFVGWKYGENKINFGNGSVILFLDLSYYPQKDPLFERLGSKEFTGGWIEEAGEVKFDAFDTLKSRIGRYMNDVYGLIGKMLITANPKKGWLYNEFYKPQKTGIKNTGYYFIPALNGDNPFLPETARDSLNMITDKVKRQRLLLGDWDYDDSEECLIQYNKILDMFTNSFVEDGERFISSDVAITNDLFVNVVWSGLKIIDISAIRNVTKTVSTHENGILVNRVDFQPLIDEYERLTTLYKIPRSNIVYDADGIGHNMRSFLSGAVGLNNGSPAPDPAYFNLKTQLYYYFAELVNSDKIWITASLNSETKDRLMEEIQAIRRSSDVGEKLKIMPKAEVKKIIGHSPDLTDAIVYRLLFLITRGK